MAARGESLARPLLLAAPELFVPVEDDVDGRRGLLAVEGRCQHALAVRRDVVRISDPRQSLLTPPMVTGKPLSAEDGVEAGAIGDPPLSDDSRSFSPN
jgi:hypothetical protein